MLGSVTAQKNKAQQIPSLKEVFKSDFLIGAALNWPQITGKDRAAAVLIPQQFNTVTPEDVMKAERLHPVWGTYDFSKGDQLIAYAKRHKLQVNGHTLVWHSQLPPFVHRIQNIDSFRTFFTDHIKTVAEHFSGKVQSWDVVNEALNEDGTLRKSIFLTKLGDQYIVDAFKLAAAAAPNTALYYNDYNNEQPAKRAGCIRVIQELKKAGARIDGVGIQGHWHLGKVPFKAIEESIEQYAAQGVKVAITELDINVLPTKVTGAEVGQHFKGDAASNPYVNGLPDSIRQQLAADYATLFRIFLKHKDKIARVTFWGVHDAQSWLNDWPIPGRRNYPLLFDRQGKPKSAFYAVIDAKLKK